MCQKLCRCFCVSLLLGTARALLWMAEAKALKALSSLAYANAGTVGQAVVPFVPLEARTVLELFQPGRAGAPSSVGHLGELEAAKLQSWKCRKRERRCHSCNLGSN